MMTILLYGHLGKTFGRVHRYDVKSAAEAVRAMCVTLENFRQSVIDGGSYRVLVGGTESLPVEQLANPVSTKKTLRIVPVIEGASKGINIIIGAILVVVGLYFNIPFLVNIGASMIIGGVAQLLFAPKASAPPGASNGVERPENRPSYAFDGAINTAAQGNPVSLLYGGPLIVGSQVISAGLATEQI